MKHLTPEDLKILKRCEAARLEISALCKGRKRGGRDWTMRIPVHETDSDMVLAALVKDNAKLLQTINDLRGRLDTQIESTRWHWSISDVVMDWLMGKNPLDYGFSQAGHDAPLVITTPGGQLVVQDGDWIHRNDLGEIEVTKGETKDE